MFVVIGDRASLTHVTSLGIRFDLLIDLDGYSDAKVVHDLARSRHVSVRTFDCSRALNQLGFKASTSLEAGLRETLEWYRSSLLAA